MPELPEVEITKRKLEPLILGNTIADFSVLWPKTLVRFSRSDKELNALIRGKRISDITRHGKVLYLWLNGGEVGIAIHQRMSGHIRFARNQKSEIPPQRGEARPTKLGGKMQNGHKKHLRFVLTFTDGSALLFIDPRKFGRIWIGTKEYFAHDPHLGQLGLDALAVSFNQFHKIVKNRKRQLKALLLDQHMIAGIGNITADESLWLAALHPKQIASAISAAQARRLFRAIRATLRRVIGAEGTSMRQWFHPDGGQGRHQSLFRVYQQTGKPCGRCSKPGFKHYDGGKRASSIRRIIVAGRSTFLCPVCQKAS